ncbi:MAG: hypothetical protein IPL34_18410 [Thiofilum sp.]|uniref:hypothetical protein n=1 Tax=Thiofilum sp. TaxID=2212733 RepID=UPI0025D5F7CC|nr:hypothetical protein [Thiofilum sp.]MBK8455266.1 hypothetical protein [Thiofilum sp.]
MSRKPPLLGLAILLTSILIGCSGSSEPSVSSGIDTPTSSSLGSSTNSRSQAQYHKILNDVGLNKVFNLGQVQETLTKDKVSFITINLFPKNINFDEKTGNIINHTRKLSELGNLVSSIIGQQIGIDSQRIELVVIEKKCKAHIVSGKVIKNCDRDTSLVFSEIKDGTIDALALLIQEIKKKDAYPKRKKEENTSILIDKLKKIESSSKTFNIENLKEFCEVVLKEKLKNYEFESDCNVISSLVNDSAVYSIIDIYVKGFITNSHYEKLELQVSNSNEMFSRGGSLKLSAKYEPTFFDWKKPDSNSYSQEISDVEIKEKIIGRWIEDYFKYR